LRIFGKAMNGNAPDTPMRDLAIEMNGAASTGAIAERIEKIGNVSALAVVQASETTAKDIKAVAQTAVDLAAEIMNEADQLAADVQRRAQKMSERLREFSSLAQKVSTAMRGVRAEVLSSRDHPMPRTSLLSPADPAPPVTGTSGEH
jgi:hypothetical protein